MPRRREGEARTDEAGRLRRLRDALELSQRELGDQFGVAGSAIAQWESGKHTIPGPALRLIEMYEVELGLAQHAAQAAGEMPVGWSARAPRAAAATVLWLVFFGTRSERETHPVMREMRRAALRRYCKLVGDLKGLAMKLEQMTWYADFVLSEPDRALLAELRGRVQPMTPAAVSQVILEELGAPPRQLFAEWSAAPFATASIGQVHRARLADGREVAVKVQYPRIVDALRVDLSQAAVVDRVLALFLPSQGRRDMLDEIATRILEECDYTVEARRQREFAEMFAAYGDVRVPAVIDRLSGRRVLTSDLVRGEPLERFARRADVQSCARAATAVLDFYLHSAITHGAFNTDPNPGNFLFGADHVTFLDFGRIKQFSPGFSVQLRRLLRAILEGNRDEFASVLVELGIVLDPTRYDFEHMFRSALLLHRPYLSDAPFRYTGDHVRRIWKAFVRDNPNLPFTHFSPDMAFLHQFNFGGTALLANLGAEVAYRQRLLDMLYQPGEPRPSAYSAEQLAMLEI